MHSSDPMREYTRSKVKTIKYFRNLQANKFQGHSQLLMEEKNIRHRRQSMKKEKKECSSKQEADNPTRSEQGGQGDQGTHNSLN